MLDDLDLRAIAVALLWIQRHRELHHQPPAPAIDRALDHLTSAMSDDGQKDVAPQPEWITTGEAARRTGYTERTIRRLAPRIGQKIGRVWAIRADALEE